MRRFAQRAFNERMPNRSDSKHAKKATFTQSTDNPCLARPRRRRRYLKR
ncbi:hypothetical protein HMPREF1155_1331 [Slackia sp. CM382]|nr:hypothetical protein HMPREF1155_1331 [Slackia sp. CM382]